MRRASFVVVALSFVASSACGRDARSYESARALAAALADGGAPCTGYAPAGAAEPAATGSGVSTGSSLVEDSGTCSAGDSDVLLFTFARAAERDRWLVLGRRLGDVVVGPNWTVVAPSAATAEAIADASGGSLD